MAIALVNGKEKRRRDAMPTPVLRALSETHGVEKVDESTIDAFLAADHALLFFAGDPAQRSETHDVAIILPQLAAAFAGRLRAAIVASEAEEALKGRFGVCVFPSLVVTRGGETLGVLPKVYDWADYLARIDALLRLEAPPVAEARPRVRITVAGRETAI
jgi:hydrogenase-1 operon protein HyaE